MTDSTPRARPMAGQVIRGALLMVALRFVVRAIGLVSAIITARILTPSDFGIIGTASIVIGVFAILQSIGVGDALIRLRTLEPTHIHTAWTINLLVSALVTAGIWVTAPAAAIFLEEPALTAVLRWLAFTSALNALVSPGTMTFLRDFAFRKEFGLKVLQKVVMVISLVIAAWVTRDYWGLIWGGMAGTVFYVVMSYVRYPYWPRLSLAKHRDFLGFSFWTFLQSLATHVALVADEVVVRRLVGTHVFGLYHISRDLSRTMVAELVAPAAAALLPGLASLRDEPARFIQAAKQAVGAGVIVAVSAGLGVSVTAPEITGLLLGPQWAGAAPFLALTAIGVAGQTVAGLSRSIFVAQDKQNWAALLWGMRAVVMVASCTLAGILGNAMTVAWTYAVASVLMTFLDYVIIFTRLGRPMAPIEIFTRPLLAGLAMVAALSLLPVGLPLLLSALLKVVIGAVTYGAALLGLWWLMGRPNGPEAALLHRLPARLGGLVLRPAAVASDEP